MVVENPISDDELDSLKQTLEDYFDYECNIEDTQTSEFEKYDYDVTLTQWRPKPSKRTIVCAVKWHEDAQDWEVNVQRKGGWLS